MLKIIPPPTFASHLDDQRRLEMSWKIWAKTGVLCEMSPLNATISIFPSHCILHNGGIGWLRFFFSILADTLYFLSRSESPRQFRFNFYIERLRHLNLHLNFVDILLTWSPTSNFERSPDSNYLEIFLLCQVRSLMNWGGLSFLHKQNNSDQLEIKTLLRETLVNTPKSSSKIIGRFQILLGLNFVFSAVYLEKPDSWFGDELLT